jgi:UDP-N-acetylglucosamine 2-epimerase (non-hydrolysing)
VQRPAAIYLSGHPRIKLISPLDYSDFVALLSRAWLIVSDSGGVQEEAPTLRKPLLILRENTERREALDAGVARLVGGSPKQLALMLDEIYQDGSSGFHMHESENPFGRGDSAKRICKIIREILFGTNNHEHCQDTDAE